MGTPGAFRRARADPRGRHRRDPGPERERTRRWLRDLIDTYDGDNRWLVTSRPSAVGQDWLTEEGFGELALSSMGRADTATFIKRWHAAARDGAESAAELDAYEAQLLTAVRTKADLGRLATNPLMCGLICALQRDRRGYLPHGRKDLYEAALSMLISRRDRERDMNVPDLREEPQLELLQRLAYWLIKNGRTEMDRSQAEDIIGRALPAVPEAAALGGASAVFEHFLQRSGLLREPTPGTVDFIHRTFQDFLGARAAVEEGDFGLLAGHAADDQWEDVIRMAVALARPRERVTLFEGLLSLGDRTGDRRVHLLAAACLEHATTLEPAVREAVEERITTLITPRDRFDALDLGTWGPLILDLLPGPDGMDESGCYYTVIAASKVASDAAIPFLAAYSGHPSLRVRSQLMWAWSRFDSTLYADEVIAHLDPDGLDYSITSDAQLLQLERLNLRAESLDVRKAVSVEALTSHLSRNKITKLQLTNLPLTDLEFLRGQSELTSFSALSCPALTDLSPLGELPISRMVIEGSPHTDLSPLNRLSTLTDLWLYGGVPLREGTVSDQDLKGLSRFASLTSLTHLSDRISAEDWQEMAELPALRTLALEAVSLETLPPDVVLAQVTALALHDDVGESDAQLVLDRLPHAFPGLVSGVYSGELTPFLDVSALADIVSLESFDIDLPTDMLQGVASLPSRLTISQER